jgi:hypothetical protein
MTLPVTGMTLQATGMTLPATGMTAMVVDSFANYNNDSEATETVLLATRMALPVTGTEVLPAILNDSAMDKFELFE